MAPVAEFLKSNASDPGAIGGRVVTPLGQPVSGALVLISGNNQSRMVTTDVSGAFDAGRFKEGDYRIEMGRSGYLTPDFFGLTDSDPTRTVHIGGDTRVLNVELVLARGGIDRRDDRRGAGEPFQGVLVRALRLRQDSGRTVAVEYRRAATHRRPRTIPAVRVAVRHVCGRGFTRRHRARAGRRRACCWIRAGLLPGDFAC